MGPISRSLARWREFLVALFGSSRILDITQLTEALIDATRRELAPRGSSG